MKKRKSAPKRIPRKHGQRNIILLSVVGLVLVGIIFHFFPLREPIPRAPTVAMQTDASTYLPRQYSDTHITKNAVTTDTQFRSVGMVNTNDFLADAGSALGVAVQKTAGQENGTWLWTPILQITPAYETQIISGAKQNGVKNIYISIDSYLDIFVMPDGADKTAKKKQFDDTLESFVTEAHKNGLTVDAEGGWRNWAETGNAYKAFAVVSYAMQFNQTEPEKLRGFQYDVEPYLLDTYKQNKADVLGNFVTLVNQTVSMMDKSDLQLSVVIPEFYDGTNGSTPSFTYQGQTGFTLDHLLNVLDERPESKIIVMSYRNWSLGLGGSIQISEDEVTTADKHATKVVVAEETGNVSPSYITFYNTNKKYYDSQVANINQAFSTDKSYAGIATHYINAYLSLK